MGALESLYQQYGDHIEFYLVYIREAHPTDGRQAPANLREEVLVRQAKSLEERANTAAAMCQKLKINLPTLVDHVDDRVNEAYSAWPDRLYLVSKDGTIAYKGGPGPRGFKPEELR